MPRYDEGNSTIRWIPGFAREWFGLTGDEPVSRRAESRVDGRSAEANSLLPLAIRRFFGLTFDEPAASGSRPAPTVNVRNEVVERPRDSAGTRYVPSPTAGTRSSGYVPTASGYASPAAGSEQRTPITGMGDLQPIEYLLRGYARGALPPQGLESFTREVRHTGEDVIGFYTKWINFQAEGLLKLGGDLLSSVVDVLPGERSGSSPAPMRRIKVTTAEENGNGHGGNGAGE